MLVKFQRPNRICHGGLFGLQDFKRNKKLAISRDISNLELEKHLHINA